MEGKTGGGDERTFPKGVLFTLKPARDTMTMTTVALMPLPRILY